MTKLHYFVNIRSALEQKIKFRFYRTRKNTD